MAFPTVTTEVAFATLPGDTPTWTDVSAYVKSMTVKGASRQRELDRFEAGTLTVEFDNSDGRFDPNNTAGPYYPNVLPMRRIRVRSTWDAVTYDLFNGYVEDWPQESAYPADAWVTVKATDAFLALAAIPLEGSPYEIEVAGDTPVAWWPLSDSATGVMTDKAGTFDGAYWGAPASGTIDAAVSMPGTYFAHTEASMGVYAASAGGPATAYPLTIEAGVQPDAVVPQDPTSSTKRRHIAHLADETTNNYGIAFRILDNVETSFPTGLEGHLDAYLGSSGQTRTVYSDRTINDGRPHHVALVIASATSALLYIDGIADTVVNLSGSPVFPTAPTLLTIGNRRNTSAGISGGFAGVIGNVAIYNSALSAATIAEHATAFLNAWKGDTTGTRFARILDAAGWPAVDRSIDAGLSTMQAAFAYSGSALDALQEIAKTEAGAVFATPAGLVKFRDRHALLKAPYTTVTGFFSDASGAYDEIAPDFAVDAIKNDARAGRAGGVVQRVVDNTSIGKFFRRRYQNAGLLFEKDAEARDHAQWIINRSKDPPFRYAKLTITPYGLETALFPVLLALDIGDRVTVTQQPPGSMSTARDEHVEGITSRIGPGPRWQWEAQLSPVDPTAYFVLDTSTLGGAHVLGY